MHVLRGDRPACPPLPMRPAHLATISSGWTVPTLTSPGWAARAPRSNRLARAGFRIPPGFCLTAQAFAAQVATIPHAWILADPRAMTDEDTRGALVDAMTRGPLAPTVAEALQEPLDRLAGEGLRGDGPMRLAVRSSGVAEDGAAASFAGLHDTELGLGAEDVVPAVLRCWASLWSDRAVAYRTRRGLALDGGAMAVVVQALVPAIAAAVAFTRHPVTGRSDQLLINSAPGLGEAMVSGLVTPDTIVVDKASRDRHRVQPGRLGRAAPSWLTKRSPSWSRCAWTWSARSGRRSTSRPRTPPTAGTCSRPDRSPPEERHDVHRRRVSRHLAGAGRSRADLGLGRHAHAGRRDAAGRRLRACWSGGGFAYGYERLEVPYRVRARVWNGYVYYAFAVDGTDAEQAAAGDRYTAARRQAIEVSDAYWHGRAIPELTEIYAWVAARPVETASLADLAEDLGRGLGANRPRLGHPLLRDPRAVPGPGRPGRPVRIGHR